MNRSIKKTAIPLSGYLYQNLTGLNFLCDWLEDPNLYRWVSFECDDEESNYQGLDDVVAQRPDGSMVLLQVKFTVDASDEANALSWEWLLAHRPKGRSLVQKWARAYSDATEKGPVDAALITNRRPDREFAACMTTANDKVDLSKVPSHIRKSLEDQLGSEGLDAFFTNFRLEHSRQHDRALERTVLDRYVPRHTTMHGWLSLRHEAIYWALHVGAPPPDGRITLPLLRGLLSALRPTPLAQNFKVPEGYSPPDHAFSTSFLERITRGSNRPTILWGSPGQGKSTFLSYICSELEKGQSPYIRHHYFLSLGDTDDRFSLVKVAQSLMAQIEDKYAGCVEGLGTEPENLRRWISACAETYREQNKSFVVVIDGLDHVWRENDGNKAPLDSLFAQLFPLPDNVTLVLGSQKVDGSHLPKSFSHHVQEHDWIELPRMSIAAVARWLSAQRDAERFETYAHAEEERAIADLAIAFHEVSGGHPLILTYSFEQLARDHRTLAPDAVRSQIASTEGDIGQYYMLLWSRLSYQARDALHLLADTGFDWPINGLESCLAVGRGELRREIGHLVHATEAGLRAFHGSLLVFASTQNDHAQSLALSLPKVVDWLINRAPPYHRWGWLWLYEARAGDATALLTNVTRDWVIDSLVAGYPAEQLAAVITSAERVAFENLAFAQAVRFRWLCTDVLNGPEFQIDDFRRVRRAALTLGSDDYPMRVMASNAHTADEQDLYILGVLFLAHDAEQQAHDFLEKLRSRINDKIESRAYNDRDFEQALLLLFDLLARTRKYRDDSIASNILSVRHLWRRLLETFVQRLGSHGDLEPLIELHAQEKWRPKHRSVIELEAVRTAAATNATIEDWPQFSQFNNHPISACWAALYGKRSPHWEFSCRSTGTDNLDYYAGLQQVEGHLHDVFFESLARSLCDRPALDLPPLKEKQGWLEQARSTLIDAAKHIAESFKRNEAVQFGRVYRLVDAIDTPIAMDDRRDQATFRKALLRIASDVFLLSKRRIGLDCIADADFAQARESEHFVIDHWLSVSNSGTTPTLSRDSGEALISDDLKHLSSAATMFNERADRYLDLCEFAQTIGAHELARAILRRVVSCVVGYGWRKNGKLYETFEALKDLAPHRPQEAYRLLERLSPMATEISRMTEDDALNAFDLAPLVLQLIPSRFPALYAFWLERSEWYYAEHTLEHLLKRIDLGTPIADLLTRSTWHAVGIAGITANKQSSAADVDRTVAAISNRYGFGKDRLPTNDRYTSSSVDGDEAPFDSSSYGPEDLSRLIADAGSSRLTLAREALDEWFDRGVRDGQGIQILRALEPFLDKSSWLSPVSALFDKAFELSKKLHGKKRAYRWLVMAHVCRQGWDLYHSEEIDARFEHVRRNYRDRWRDFVVDTSISVYRSSNLVIPGTRLVELMVKMEEFEEAVAVASAMTDSVVESFRDQPLQRPTWLGEEGRYA